MVDVVENILWDTMWKPNSYETQAKISKIDKKIKHFASIKRVDIIQDPKKYIVVVHWFGQRQQLFYVIGWKLTTAVENGQNNWIKLVNWFVSP